MFINFRIFILLFQFIISRQQPIFFIVPFFFKKVVTPFLFKMFFLNWSTLQNVVLVSALQ